VKRERKKERSVFLSAGVWCGRKDQTDREGAAGFTARTQAVPSSLGPRKIMLSSQGKRGKHPTGEKKKGDLGGGRKGRINYIRGQEKKERRVRKEKKSTEDPAKGEKRRGKRKRIYF